MAESSERAVTPDEASGGAAARDQRRFASSRPAIIPFEDT